MRIWRTIRQSKADLNSVVLAVALLFAQSTLLAHAAEHEWDEATATVCMTCASAQIGTTPAPTPEPVCQTFISQAFTLPCFEPIQPHPYARTGKPRAPPSIC